MIEFLRQSTDAGRFELLIDAAIFNEVAVLKAAYNLLDKGYFFFRREGANFIVQGKTKEGVALTGEALLGEFSDSLLDFKLRDTLERDNKPIREAIVGAALGNALDARNYLVGINPDAAPAGVTPVGQIDFDKDIDQILKEIENDPELKIDQAEIDKILKEIEAEAASAPKPALTIDPKALADAKKKFQAGK